MIDLNPVNILMTEIEISSHTQKLARDYRNGPWFTLSQLLYTKLKRLTVACDVYKSISRSVLYVILLQLLKISKKLVLLN